MLCLVFYPGRMQLNLVELVTVFLLKINISFVCIYYLIKSMDLSFSVIIDNHRKNVKCILR